MPPRPKFEDPETKPASKREEPVTASVRDGTVKKVGDIPKTALFYRTRNPNVTGIKEARKYYVGKVLHCYAEVKEEGYGKTLKGEDRPYIAYMGVTSEYGNGSQSFATEKDLHAFLLELATATLL